jgi:lipoprotein-releasing system permease protein
MRFELFIALRYLLAKRKHAFISAIAIVSVLGVGLGVAALIIVMGVMNGFTTDLREKIMGLNAHAMVLGAGAAMRESPELLAKSRAAPGVTGVMPFIHSELMVSGPGGFKGVAIRGVDPENAKEVLGIAGRITRGNFDDIAGEGALPGIVIGRELSRLIGASVGARINLLAPSGDRSAAGFTPRIRAARVVGIFATGMIEYDSSLGLVSLETARDILGVTDGIWITGLEVTVDDVYDAEKTAEALTRELGPTYFVRTWMDMHASLYAALKLEKAAMAIMLTLVVLVGSFSIITTLVMLVMEKTRDIAILMSMGATGNSIRRIFVCQGVVIGAVGTALGYILGIGASLLLKRYQFIKLPEGVYSLDYLPVLLIWTDLAAIGAGAMLICLLATIYPSRQAAKLEPVEALRYE